MSQLWDAPPKKQQTPQNEEPQNEETPQNEKTPQNPQENVDPSPIRVPTQDLFSQYDAEQNLMKSSDCDENVQETVDRNCKLLFFSNCVS